MLAFFKRAVTCCRKHSTRSTSAVSRPDLFAVLASLDIASTRLRNRSHV